MLAKYNTEIPDKDWKSLVVVPESLEAAYAIGVATEEKNIAMYKRFLNENLSDDVREVFEKLMNASEKHLSAYQRQVDGNKNGSINGNGRGKNRQAGKTANCIGGNGRGNRSTSQGSCIL